MLTLFAGLALAGSVFAILYEANKNGLALMMAKDGFAPTLPMHVAVWGTLTVAVSGAAAFPFALAYVQARFDETRPPVTAILTPPAPTPEEQKKARHAGDGLSFMGDIIFDREGGPPGASSTIGGMLYAGEAGPGPDDFWVRAGRIDYEDGTSANFSVGVLFDSRSWKIGSSHRPEAIRGSEGIAVENAIRTTRVRDLVQGHLFTICLGLASAEAQNGPVANEQLSDDRAYHLCKALLNLNYVQPRKVKGLGLGVAPARWPQSLLRLVSASQSSLASRPCRN